MRDVDIEYHGEPLKLKECDCCGRELFLYEKLRKLRDYGKVCEDCYEYIKEGE